MAVVPQAGKERRTSGCKALTFFERNINGLEPSECLNCYQWNFSSPQWFWLKNGVFLRLRKD
jgi:hypothetical protein